MSAAAKRLPEEGIIRTAIERQMRLRANASSAELHKQLHEWRRRDARYELA
ncbi:hypothetical protein CFII64_14093 [Pseudomonas sp. CFII64]|jgi:transmembrane sensor|uniref:hypothetical protein n=1 Tax=Pseudomonas sp. CFII64 TaxID=911242 RepID=UPI00035740D9|nr:hypothetical protein [Pseudomonas sp. CFII64]EPJ84855.1 hypothetical protein CFII64_14093 [Pseudomonas sp. CFII64]